MKKLTIGIVGGTTPQSTLEYYDYIIKSYIEMYNNHSYPAIIIYSVNFQNYLDWMTGGDWQKIEDDLVETLVKLVGAGADFALIATNTLHKVYPGVQKRSTIKILSIIDCVSEKIKESGIEVAGLLGTKYTMEEEFYREGLRKKGINCIVPEDDDLEIINEIIFNELSKGIINENSRTKYLEIIGKLESRGARGIILGCTEMPLLITQENVEIPVFDRALLTNGHRITGPGLVESEQTSLLIPPEWGLAVDKYNNMILKEVS